MWVYLYEKESGIISISLDVVELSLKLLVVLDTWTEGLG